MRINDKYVGAIEGDPPRLIDPARAIFRIMENWAGFHEKRYGKSLGNNEGAF